MKKKNQKIKFPLSPSCCSGAERSQPSPGCSSPEIWGIPNLLELPSLSGIAEQLRMLKFFFCFGMPPKKKKKIALLTSQAQGLLLVLQHRSRIHINFAKISVGDHCTKTISLLITPKFRFHFI